MTAVAAPICGQQRPVIFSARAKEKLPVLVGMGVLGNAFDEARAPGRGRINQESNSCSPRHPLTPISRGGMRDCIIFSERSHAGGDASSVKLKCRFGFRQAFVEDRHGKVDVLALDHQRRGKGKNVAHGDLKVQAALERGVKHRVSGVGGWLLSFAV